MKILGLILLLIVFVMNGSQAQKQEPCVGNTTAS